MWTRIATPALGCTVVKPCGLRAEALSKQKVTVPQLLWNQSTAHSLRNKMLAIAFLSALLVATAAQQNGKNPIHDVCRRHGHLTAVIDSTLYIFGGRVFYGNGMTGSQDDGSKSHRPIVACIY